MKLKLRLDFTEEQREGLLEFQDLLNSTEDVKKDPKKALSLEQVCKQAIFYAINDSYRRGKAIEQQQRAIKEQASGVSAEANVAGVTGEVLSSEVVNTAPLADTQKSGDSSATE